MTFRLEQRLEQFLDALEEAVLLVDGQSPNGMQIVGSNARANALLGYPRDELARLTLVDLRPAGDVRGDPAYETRRARGSFEGAVGVRRKDGTAFEAQVRSVSLTSVDGRGLVAIVIRDLTDQQRLAATTAALRDSEDLLRALADAAFEAVIIHRDGGVIVTANRAAEALVGVGPGALVGRQLFDFVAAESRASVSARIRQGDERSYPGVLQRADGTRVHVEAQARNTPVMIEGRPARVVAVRDVSERLALEEQVRQVQKMEAIGRLAGGVAHDFNNLLSVILMAGSSAKAALGPGHPASDELGDVLEAAQRASLLTKQLLAFGRKQVLAPKVVELDAAVTRLEAMFRRLVPETITLSFSPAAPGARVHIDLSQLEMAVMNLVVNACEAMTAGGSLEVSTAAVELDATHPRAVAEGRAGPHALLVVSDTGPGMDEPTLARVFEPFFTTRAHVGGTGLGLATVFGAVRQAGGSIWAESAPGRGARFTIALPRVDEAVSAPEPEVQSQPGASDRTILLAEDEPAVRAVTLRLLRRAGYRVLEAATGDEALAVAERHQGSIDLLLTDMVMPGRNGQQVAEALRARRPTLRVLIVSGYTEQAVATDQVAFLAKPVMPNVLLAKVAELLR